MAFASPSSPAGAERRCSPSPGHRFVRLEPGTTKNQEGRAFPITPALRAILDRRQELTRRCERAQARIIPLIFHRSGRPIESFRRSWKKACEKAGLPGLLFHDLRRSAVRNLERATVPRSVAMKLTGHKTESIYRRYAIVAETDLRDAGIKLAAASSAETSATAASEEGKPETLPAKKPDLTR
jgi:integrase